MTVIAAALWRGVAFALLWWTLAEGRTENWGLGLAIIGLATLASLRLLPATALRLSPRGLLGFGTFFLVQSIRAGTQVAIMALRHRLDLAPAMLELPITLPPGAARIWLANTLSLLPGTLSVDIGATHLRLHVLDRRLPIAHEVAQVEARIAAVLGMEK
ncbi:MAG: hypothetical protein CVV05_10680 [Gammaproteobacteria bacterium HGW-Gammaproteobacteria-1]|jgi:multicomponent Na+:H+ antiporter subunit E|nr:MAG: hypothetical protein CVV05_10680 [Gammaproteobacteria bacterium HGW-Gammaproteobacteria-1]